MNPWTSYHERWRRDGTLASPSLERRERFLNESWPWVGSSIRPSTSLYAMGPADLPCLGNIGPKGAKGPRLHCGGRVESMPAWRTPSTSPCEGPGSQSMDAAAMPDASGGVTCEVVEAPACSREGILGHRATPRDLSVRPSRGAHAGEPEPVAAVAVDQLYSQFTYGRDSNCRQSAWREASSERHHDEAFFRSLGGQDSHVPAPHPDRRKAQGRVIQPVARRPRRAQRLSQLSQPHRACPIGRARISRS